MHAAPSSTAAGAPARESASHRPPTAGEALSRRHTEALSRRHTIRVIIGELVIDGLGEVIELAPLVQTDRLVVLGLWREGVWGSRAGGGGGGRPLLNGGFRGSQGQFQWRLQVTQSGWGQLLAVGGAVAGG